MLTIHTLQPAAVADHADQVMVAMRDGVRLATDVYLPPRRSATETILIRMPYDKSGRYSFLPAVASWLTERDYAVVVQDVRGKFRSEGETVPFVHEVYDGYDTLEWIIRRPFSNGIVGMFGDSYYGWTQWAALASGHPALRALVPRVTATDLGSTRAQTDWNRAVVPMYMAQYFATNWTDELDHEWEVDWSVRPLAGVFDDAFAQLGARSAAFDRMRRDAAGAPPYPTGHPFGAREVPTLHSVGWFDNLNPESIHDFAVLQASGRSLQYLIGEPADHESYALDDVPIVTERDHGLDDGALDRFLPSYLGPATDFFDVYLRGRTEPPPRVRWRAGNGGSHHAERWPAPGTVPRRLYLDAADRATADARGGRLVDAPPASTSHGRWGHDPTRLVPSTVTDPFGLLRELPDETRVHDRDDVLTFTGEPADEALELAGAVVARLAIEAAVELTQVYAKLTDVHPCGHALMLARGQVVVRGARGGALVSVFMGHTAHVVRPGHRLRLHVAASDFPLYLPLFGDGGDPWRATGGTTVTHSLRAGGLLRSFIEFDALAGA